MQDDTMQIAPQQDSYSSPAMQARRQRIMLETRGLIAEQGIHGFSLAELCRRADVAKQTLYYAFGNKEHLIAAAIRDYFEEFEATIPYRSRKDTLERLIERTVAISRRNLNIRNYVAAIVSFYFSSSTDGELWQAIHDIMTQPQRPYVERLAAERQIQPWTDAEQLIDALDGHRLSIANDWVHGRINDNDFVDRVTIGQLICLAGSVRGAARKAAEACLKEIAAHGVQACLDHSFAAIVD